MDPPSLKNKLWLWFLGFDLIILNTGVGYLAYKSFVSTSPVSPPNLGGDQRVVVKDQCGPDCQSYIDSRMVKPTAISLSVPTPTPTPKTIGQPVVKTKVRSTSYLPIPSTGSTRANDWANLSGTEFYFDLSNYTGVVEVRLEANLHLTNGNGIAYIRLYDVTHGIGVQGSDAQTTSQTSTAIESGKVTFWSGNNSIRVQAKSLTADTVVFDGGRLRIITEN